MNMNLEYFNDFESFINKNINSDKTFVLYVASKTLIDLEYAKKANITFAGGIFPEIIFGNKLYTTGLISIEMTSEFELKFIDNIHDTLENETLKCNSLISIVNGFSKYNETFLSDLFGKIPLDSNIIGAGAGILDNSEKKCLFNNTDFYKDSAILILVNSVISIGVKHGFKHLDGPFLVTESDGSVLKSLDYQNAFDVYAKCIYDDCGVELTKDNFYNISQGYALGIVKYKDEVVVRDPIGVKNGELMLVGEINKNSVINVLKGDKDSLIQAAHDVADEIITSESSTAMMFDCISRLNYLDSRFEEEMSILNSSKNVFGAITCGEIANSGNKYITFLNKTCVVGSLCH